MNRIRNNGAQAPSAPNSEILDRLPPQNLDAEKGVLGSLLLDPDLCDEVLMIVRPDDFYADRNRTLFAQIMAMHEEGKKIDSTLLVERLKAAGELEAVGGLAYLGEVAQSVPVAAHAEHYAQIVGDKATLRGLIQATTEILRDAYQPTLHPLEMVNRAEEKIFALHDQRSSDQIINIHDLLVQLFELKDSDRLGVPTGFNDLDNLTGGLQDSHLVILAGRPIMGKTALATNIAEHVTIDSNIPTLFVSLEMANIELAERMTCCLGKVNLAKSRDKYLSGEDRKHLVEASAKLSKAPLFIDDTPSRTVSEIGACARRLKRRENLGLVIIDYLQLIQPDNLEHQRQEQVAKITRRLKGLARELKLPILCLAQLNRAAEAGGSHRPRLSHLRESGAIEQDADLVLLIHREEVFHTMEKARELDVLGKADLLVAKQRSGPTGEVKLAWFGKYTRFENRAKERYDHFDNIKPF